ncbi:PaaI family thioesterase [Roseobacteraceae bacterium S113]
MGEITYGTLSLEELTSVSGLDYFRGVIDGLYPHPPIAAHTRMRITEIEKGMITWAVRAPETMINPMGAVHGGFAMTVLDSALGCAVHSMLEPGQAYTTIEAKVNMTRPVPLDEELICVGKVITMGRRVATSEAQLTDGRGRVLAFGTSSLLIMQV